MFNFNNSNTYDRNGETVKFEDLQKAREDLIGELQAIIGYDAHLHSTNDKIAKETWMDIKDEELTHVGELLGLLNYLDPTQKQFVQKGFAEFTQRVKR